MYLQDSPSIITQCLAKDFITRFISYLHKIVEPVQGTRKQKIHEVYQHYRTNGATLDGEVVDIIYLHKAQMSPNI